MALWSSSPDTLALLQDACLSIFDTPPEMPVYEWLEENATLSTRESTDPGQFSTTGREYVREPLESFRDKSVSDLVLCWATQTSKTMTIMGGAAWMICNDPMNGLWVMPNRDLCKSFSTNRWIPFVEGCPPLLSQKPGDRFLWKTLEQYFSKVTLTFVGSNSPANLASRPAGMLLMDEIDKFELKSDREAGALQNAEERTTTFPFPKRVKTSTPTTNEGEIWKEFLSGDQRYFHVPCPHCGQFIVLKWEQMRAPENLKDENGEYIFELIRKQTYYLCQLCSEHIFDAQKTSMVRAGKWIATNQNNRSGKRSYHLSALYSAMKETQWGVLMQMWLESKGDMSRRHRFINSKLAEVWDLERIIDDEPMNTVPYEIRSLPVERINVMTVDVQLNHFWVVVRAWGRGSRSWLLWEGKIETKEEVEAKAVEFQLQPNRVGVDIADETNPMCQWIVKNDWRGLWGADRTGYVHALGNGVRVIRDFSPTQMRDPFVGTVHASGSNKPAVFVFWANDPIKDRLHTLRYSGNWNIFPNISEDYVKQMNSEMKMMKINPKTGRAKWFWKKVRKHNHLWDCEAMQVAMALVSGLVEEDTRENASNAQQNLMLTC